MTRFLLTAASVLALTIGAANAQSSSGTGSSGTVGTPPMGTGSSSDRLSSPSTTLDKDCDLMGSTANRSAPGTSGSNSSTAMDSRTGTNSTACPPGSGSSAPSSKSNGGMGTTGGNSGTSPGGSSTGR